MRRGCAIAVMVLTSCAVPDVPLVPADEAESPPPDYVARAPLHRLNALEYDNTVRDLLGTTLSPGRDFPPDPVAEGFDNHAGALVVSPTWLAAVDRAARLVVDDALWRRTAFEHTTRGDALATAAGYPIGESWALSGDALIIEVEIPEAGTYEVVLEAGAIQTGAAPWPLLDVAIDGEVRHQDVEVDGSAADPARHYFSASFDPGLHTLSFAPTNFTNFAPDDRANNVAIQSVRVVSGLGVTGPGFARVFTCAPDPVERPDCAAEVIARFARRAWRRPLADDERRALVALHDELLAGGETPLDAVRLVIRHILTSPRFLYRSRASRPEWADFALATRLAYFLWGTTPSDPLLDYTEAGILSTLDGRRAVVRGMLDDPRSRSLLDGFAEQWLGVRALAVAAPSPEVFPGFTESVRSAMATEAREVFGDFLHNDLPVARLLDPGFGYLSDGLAVHYGLPPVGHIDVQRVPLGPGQRQGLLTFGSWLVAQSDAERSSPIRRGRWVSENVLCTQVPPPPADLEIPEIDFDAEALTVREQLQAHRAEPACAACHALLDVVGIGFEEIDGSGAPRQGDVDTLGELPGGPAFEGAAGLAAVVDPDQFARCVREKLFVYAMGRGPDPVDRHWLDHTPMPASTLPDLVLQITDSPLFHDSTGAP